ncbi:hypothetical protein O6H91_06G101800 [Diphasiastrum complanatum]|uniref:Uncharacterized protein n=1 Tax=Diphasiastrum complanatum TaxID=34168 RepID=A0ACC2DGW4_DIPCM|nr:hypothetical protein O6H91_06G101800 [Diphasiastrum complanatum]
MDGVVQHISNGVSPPCTLRWHKRELIGSGTYGRVYMGLDLDFGELIAVKQVLVTANIVTKEKTQLITVDGSVVVKYEDRCPILKHDSKAYCLF